MHNFIWSIFPWKQRYIRRYKIQFQKFSREIKSKKTCMISFHRFSRENNFISSRKIQFYEFCRKCQPYFRELLVPQCQVSWKCNENLKGQMEEVLFLCRSLWNSQCGNLRIFLPRFYVKSTLAKLNSQKCHFENLRSSEFRLW